jgi:hypothetical protein
VTKISGSTKEAPKKFIRLFALAETIDGQHVDMDAHCYAPNGESIPCEEYDRISLVKKNGDTNLIEHEPLPPSQIDAINPLTPLKPSHSIDLPQIAYPQGKEHAETSTSTSDVSFSQLAQVFDQF